MKLRLTNKEDYNELCEWWSFWRWKNPPSLTLLDNLRFGLMVSNGEENICAGFIYFTNAKEFALMEYIVSTPKVKDKGTRKKALLFLISALKELAKQKGVTTLISYLINENLINHYLQSGFVTGDKNAIAMIGKI